jgi:hypothetical protein
MEDHRTHRLSQRASGRGFVGLAGSQPEGRAIVWLVRIWQSAKDRSLQSPPAWVRVMEGDYGRTTEVR